MSAPIQLDGPYHPRSHQRLMAALRILRTLAIAAAVVVGVPMIAGVLYALAYY